MRAICLLVVSAVMLSASVAHANFDRARDLIALHYDHAPDRDDAHAAVAGLMVTRSLQLQVIVVGGAYGRWNADRYDAGSEAVMDATWGADWLNAHSNGQAALTTSLARWSQTLRAGADVWVAEGGQSDFTASLVRRIQQDLPGIDTRNRIHVIQHSDWNEVHADQQELDYTRNNTDYIRIEDGNFANSTADLNQQSQAFVDTVLASQYASAWQAAFDYLSPGEKLDFSDAVELLHIVGVGLDQVRTPDDFAARFIGDGAVSYQPPSMPMYWSDSYSVDGQCFCDTNFDHALDTILVDTPLGSLSVVRICDDIRQRYGEGSGSGRLYYNTVQCGHGPINDAPDEARCPGFLTDSTGSVQEYSCAATGARWNLERLYGNSSNDTGESDADNPPDNNDQTDAGNSGSGDAADEDGDASGDASGDGSGAVPNDDGSFPVCVAADSDPDGDGFGWEDGRSCTMPVDSADVPGTDQDVGNNVGTSDDDPANDDGQDGANEANRDAIGVGPFSVWWLLLCASITRLKRVRTIWI